MTVRLMFTLEDDGAGRAIGFCKVNPIGTIKWEATDIRELMEMASQELVNGMEELIGEIEDGMEEDDRGGLPPNVIPFPRSTT